MLVPDKPKEGEEIVWRCVLVDCSIASKMIFPGIKWRVCLLSPDLHGTSNDIGLTVTFRISMAGL